MKKLVVVADDFGLCESVNTGIVRSHQQGIVTELSFMLGSPGTNHALRLAGEENIANIGIHMLLKNWRDTGTLVHRADYIKLFDETSEAGIARLVENELQEFETVVGHKPSHITSQFGIAAHAKAMPSVLAYARRHGIPLRQPVMTLYGDEPEQNLASLSLMKQSGATTTDYFFARIMEPDYDTLLKQYQDDFSTIPDGQSAELAIHPGLVGADLAAMSSLVHERARDLRLATDPQLRSWLDNHGIKLVPYDEI
ncbi:MAG: chitin disaccharide deacetylase [Patescibacteria group bacterium]|nr:chitin disaccharide deacetylase [Patescibacteria group bacterium]